MVARRVGIASEGLVVRTQRGSRAAAICALANVLVWASFLTFNPRLDDAEFSRIERQRLQRDTGLGGLDLVTDQPIVVAARWHGTFGAVNFADWLLGVFAAPAISFADAIVVPPRYSGTDATKRESYVIAVTGFVLSTGFWVSFGDAVTALRSLYRRRAATERLELAEPSQRGGLAQPAPSSQPLAPSHQPLTPRDSCAMRV